MLQHKYLSTVKKLKLFKGVKSFNDIQQQIERHSDLNKDLGDAFEVFAEAYLSLGLNAPYEKVLPENKITKKHFDRLQITSSDTNVRGIDGVLTTSTKEFHTYQVKYRSHGEKLSWNDLTGSVAASIHADALLIFTNAIDIDDDISQRNVYSIKYDKLNELQADDFKRIEELIYKGKKKKKRVIKLDPYQKDAIKAVLNKLKTDSRTQLLMPCGSGKTIVGQRIIEKIDDAKTILILVPTLQLLNDTFESYYNDTSWDSFPYMCVGSKVVDSRAYDQIDADPSELPIVTRTDSETVKQFLSKKLHKYVIFSTYKSLPVVAEALGKKSVDVAIFDEAHNTAAKQGGFNAFGLEDSNIKIEKRIFMTATPRKYQLRRKNEEDMRISYSMDNKDIFGEIAYKLSFKKAADEYGAICRYKVIISVISSDYYTRDDLKSSDVLIGFDEVNAENIAKQIALTDAVKKNNISKIISFHPTIAHSENFVGDKDISIKNRLDGFELFNVSSKQKMGIRRSNMLAFKSSKKGLISNAQCLNEGVDVPAVDMVSFMHPKKSTVSIVQAVGRAIRKPRGSKKELGYVFIPIFLEKSKDETIEEAADKTDFKAAFEVINALRDHDDVLDEIITNLKIEKGYKGKITGSRLNEFINIDGFDLSIEYLKKHIYSEVVDKMAATWYENYGSLKKYYRSKGHSRVKKDENSILYTFIDVNRRLRKRDQLAENKIDLLDQVDFDWDPFGNIWEIRFISLLKAQKKHKTKNITRGQDSSVSHWLGSQRTLFNQGLLNDDKKHKLINAGVIFDLYSHRFEKRYDELAAYKDEFGHCNVPSSYENTKLANFVSVCRQAMRGVGNRSLTTDQKTRLKELGLTDYRLIKWHKNIEEIKVLIESSSTTLQKIISSPNIENIFIEFAFLVEAMVQLRGKGEFTGWLYKQNDRLNKGYLTNDQEKIFKSLLSDKSELDKKYNDSKIFTWVSRFYDYYQLVLETDNSHIKRTLNNSIHQWEQKQRRDYLNNKLDKWKYDLLEQFNFIFNDVRFETQWRKYYPVFVELYNKHGHCNIGISQNPKIGNFTKQIINLYKNKDEELTKNHIRSLNELNFEFHRDKRTRFVYND